MTKRKKREMIDWLVVRRLRCQQPGGSVTPEIHRSLLETGTKAELAFMIRRIRESEENTPVEAETGVSHR